MDIYQKFIKQLTSSIASIDPADNIVSIYLGGSTARGDYVAGASDIDIYIVVNNTENIDKINSHIQGMAKQTLGQLLSWCPDGVTAVFTTYDEIKNGTSWLGAKTEYFSFQKTGKLLYGKDIKPEIVEPSEHELLLSIAEAIEHLKQVINQDVSNINKDRYFIRSVFGTAFSAMYFDLCRYNIYIRGKERIVLEFQKTNSFFSKQANDILLLWNTFCCADLNESESNSLIKLTRTIVSNI